MVDVRLDSFGDTHLQVYRVTDNVYFGRLKLIEQVTVVPVSVADGVIILGQALLHVCLVVDITFLHVQQS